MPDLLNIVNVPVEAGDEHREQPEVVARREHAGAANVRTVCLIVFI